MGKDILMLVVSLCLILASCAIFVNAIECFGKRFKLHQGIIGSIFAAVGTALPETIIPIIAIIFNKGDNAHAVGIGAIAGAPFMLPTLTFFVTGAAVLIYAALRKRSIKMNVNSRMMSNDLIFFLIVYGIAIITSLFHYIIWLKITIAVILFFSYTIYLRIIINDNAEQIDNVDALYLNKFFCLPENALNISIQLFISLAVIVFGAHLFIIHVQGLAAAIGFSPLLLSLIVTPVATEMPEKFNSVIWIGRKKDTLAIGNITGAMVFQSCIPVVFGMIFTDWHLRNLTLVSATLALLAGVLTLTWLKIFKQINAFVLMFGGLLYSIFLLHVFVILK